MGILRAEGNESYRWLRRHFRRRYYWRDSVTNIAYSTGSDVELNVLAGLAAVEWVRQHEALELTAGRLGIDQLRTEWGLLTGEARTRSAADIERVTADTIGDRIPPVYWVRQLEHYERDKQWELYLTDWREIWMTSASRDGFHADDGDVYPILQRLSYDERRCEWSGLVTPDETAWLRRLPTWRAEQPRGMYVDLLRR
jgi:hypothetical protein